MINNTDRTKLNDLSPNLNTGQVADPAKRLQVFQEIYSYLDSIITDLNAYQSGGAVKTVNLADGAVLTVKLADNAVTGPKILDGAIATLKLTDGSVTTVKLADKSVDAGKLADDAVSKDKLTPALRDELNNKTQSTGDHQGTWRGLLPGEVAEAINGGRLDVVEPQIFTINNRAFIVNEADVQLLQSKLKTGEGISYAALGDSTEAGIGNGGGNYGETNHINNYSGQNLFALSLMRSDDNFMPPDSSVFPVDDPNIGNVPVLIEAHKLIKSANPSFSYACKQKGPYKYNRLTVYYIERTADAAAKFDIVANGVTTTVDTYTASVVFAGVSNPINPRVRKVTVNIPATTDVSFTINNVQVVDRGSGLPTDGTAVIVGFALGNGVDFRNYAVSSTTLLNNSTANQSRGITTDERLAKAYAMNVNVISLGFGTNDSKTGVSSVEAFKTDLKACIDQIRAQNPKTIIILNTDPRGKTGSIYENNPAYNQAIREVAIEKNVNCLDVEYLFDNLSSSVYSDDVHPSNVGYYAIGKALSAMFKTEFVYAKTKSFLVPASIYTPDADPGQLFSEVVLVGGASDFSGSFVQMASITMARPTGKYNVRVSAQINLARAGVIDSQFQIELTGYADAAATVPIAPTDIVLTRKTILDNGSDSADATEMRIAEVVLEGMRKLVTPKAVKVVLKGKNWMLRSADASSEFRVMFW